QVGAAVEGPAVALACGGELGAVARAKDAGILGTEPHRPSRRVAGVDHAAESSAVAGGGADPFTLPAPGDAVRGGLRRGPALREVTTVGRERRKQVDEIVDNPHP